MILLDGLLNIISGFGEICNFVFFPFLSVVPFYQVFVVTSKIKMIHHFIAVTFNGLKLLVRWPDQGTPQNFGETILLHFLIDTIVLIKNQDGVEL